LSINTDIGFIPEINPSHPEKGLPIKKKEVPIGKRIGYSAGLRKSQLGLGKQL
jgi:hypothetical protein